MMRAKEASSGSGVINSCQMMNDIEECNQQGEMIREEKACWFWITEEVFLAGLKSLYSDCMWPNKVVLQSAASFNIS
jgi:hypothetical protein